MTPYVPAAGFTSQLNIPYGPSGPDTTLDVFSSEVGGDALPTVVWIHGGAWISGDKSNVAPYLQILAADGYTTVGVNYTIAPEADYPTAITQINSALAYLLENAATLRIDPNRIVLAGDSAGSQLASQVAAMTTNPAFAQEAGIEPALSPTQLRAVILNCGVYDLDELSATATGITGWGFKTALWAYTGERDWSDTRAGAQMSTIDFVTADFPATYISGGNGDGLTAGQSKPFAARLTELGVPVTELFWPDDHTPSLPHEYQFHLDFDGAKTALQQTLDFLSSVTATP
ncbi:esterase [Amnibacterium flavum]|uniref:Esterase n=2 Tax=Amnibacterium flavum TaxID=2173173 RepID=A0A2V1HUQ1_9MICO|nr:esterase [Amnibacterium flavum]